MIRKIVDVRTVKAVGETVNTFDEIALNPGKPRSRRLLAGCVALGILFGFMIGQSFGQTSNPDVRSQNGRESALGREVSVPAHLQDGQEFTVSLAKLLSHGKLLFNANWTEQEGGGRPLTKGTGRPLSDPSRPLTGSRAFNRISAPDANSCAGCHNSPYGISGGGGDFVTNVFVLAQRFDSVTFDPSDKLATRGTVDEAGQTASLQTIANLRATTGMFGAGYLEMLARQITEDLQRIRDSINRGETKELVAKGIHFGKLTLTSAGLWDTSRVEGLSRLSLLSTGSHNPPSLVIRPWHQASNVVSLREFSNTAFNHHHGIQATERFGLDTDPDGDGFKNELTRADVTAVTVWQATLQVPGRVIPRDPEVERAVLLGERTFERIGCATCHIPRLPLDKQGWIYSEPSPFNLPGNLRSGETRDLKVDLSSDVLPAPRLRPDAAGIVWVDAYTDFKLHDICEPDEAEPLDMNQSQWSKKFKEGNRRFLTKRLWGAANEPPFFHHGLFTTLRQSVLAHSGDARDARLNFQGLPATEQDAVIEFLKTLQVLPPGTKDRIVDENYRARSWPPQIIQEPIRAEQKK
ncbi:MAG TPA: thiol oxidoreductase [Blastocatellia bacterium]|nr:thiol oxidoreductase [Blastocatellia bacterium]